MVVVELVEVEVPMITSRVCDSIVDVAVDLAWVVGLDVTLVDGASADAISGAELLEPHAATRQSTNARTPIDRGLWSAGVRIGRERPTSKGDSRAQFICDRRRFATLRREQLDNGFVEFIDHTAHRQNVQNALTVLQQIDDLLTTANERRL